jgi:hypothetical protein
MGVPATNRLDQRIAGPLGAGPVPDVDDQLGPPQAGGDLQR